MRTSQSVLLLLALLGCETNASRSGEEDKDPFMGSMCGYAENSIVFTLPVDGVFDLVAIDLDTGDLHKITDSPNSDEHTPAFNDQLKLLTFVQSTEGLIDAELKTLDVSENAQTILSADKGYRISSVTCYGSAEWFFTGDQGSFLASENEVYRLLRDGDDSRISKITLNDRIDSGIFASPRNEKVYWNQSSKGNAPSIICYDQISGNTKIIGTGSLFDYSEKLESFLRGAGGMGRMSTVEIWNHGKASSETVPVDRHWYLLDRCFSGDSKYIACLLYDGDKTIIIRKTECADLRLSRDLVTLRNVGDARWKVSAFKEED